MLKISATKLRNNLFKYLKKASGGETIIIQKNKKDVARIGPIHKINWRDKISIKPKILVSEEEFIKPIEDIWMDYE